jgi:hypothetical protein
MLPRHSKPIGRGRSVRVDHVHGAVLTDARETDLQVLGHQEHVHQRPSWPVRKGVVQVDSAVAVNFGLDVDGDGSGRARRTHRP